MYQRIQKPKPAAQSKTIQFAAVKPLLLAIAIVLIGAGAENFGLQLDSETTQLVAETVVASLPFLAAEIWLRFKTVGPITLKVS